MSKRLDINYALLREIRTSCTLYIHNYIIYICVIFFILEMVYLVFTLSGYITYLYFKWHYPYIWNNYFILFLYSLVISISRTTININSNLSSKVFLRLGRCFSVPNNYNRQDWHKKPSMWSLLVIPVLEAKAGRLLTGERLYIKNKADDTYKTNIHSCLLTSLWVNTSMTYPLTHMNLKSTLAHTHTQTHTQGICHVTQ